MTAQLPPRSFGIFSQELRTEDATRHQYVREAAAELGELGFAAVWLGGSSSVGHAARLIEATTRITVATGITNIWFDSAEEVARERAALEAAHPGRFLLGLGASHGELAANYRRPFSAMVEYLDRLDAVPEPVPTDRRVLAALGPKMLRLSADRAAGAHPYLVNPEFVSRARELMGEGPLLAPEVTVVLDRDADRARVAARAWIGYYLKLPNYTTNVRRLGFTDADFERSGSDRLIDELVVWGSDDVVGQKLAAFHEAGADHLALQIIGAGSREFAPREAWRRVADIVGLSAPSR